MTAPPADALTILKEYGLAGVMAWLFWWTLRRMMASHDATVRGLKEQLDTQADAARAVGENFARTVQNHLNHVADCLARFDAGLTHHAEEQHRWQDRLLHTLEQISVRLGGPGGG
jgi:hypothetical protein